MPARRLLVVIDCMEVGGSQRQISCLLGGMDRARWEAELLFFRSPSFLSADLQRKGITVHHIPKRGKLDPGFVLRYAALLRRGRYDLVHAFSRTAELWTVLTSLLIRRPAPLISSVRGLYLDESGLFWKLKRFVINRSAAVIANARAGAEAASLRSGVSIDRFDVVANGVVAPQALDAEQREAKRRELGVPAGRPFALFVGRMVKEKNLGCLLRAMAELEPAARPWLALAGDGPLREELQAQAASLGIDRDLRFLGERSDSGALMQASDFLVLPSRMEGLPNVILEAMMAGCPVIGAEVGGIPELIQDGVSGLLFPNDDAQSLAVCLDRMGSDPELRARLAEAARRHSASTYSVEAMVDATMSVYDRCLSHPATARTSTAAGRSPDFAQSPHDPDQRPLQ